MKSIQEVLRFIKIASEESIKNFEIQLKKTHNKGSSVPSIFKDLLATHKKLIKWEEAEMFLKNKYPYLTQDAFKLKNEITEFVLKTPSKSIFEEVAQLLQKAYNLNNKGFFVWAHEHNQKAEKLAYEYEVLELLPAILKLKKQLESKVTKIETIQDDVYQECKKTLNKLQRLNEVSIRMVDLEKVIADKGMGSRDIPKTKLTNIETQEPLTNREAVRQEMNKILILTEQAKWDEMLSVCQVANKIFAENIFLQNTLDTKYSFFVYKELVCLQVSAEGIEKAKQIIPNYDNYAWKSFGAQAFFEQYMMPLNIYMYNQTETVENRANNLEKIERLFLKNKNLYMQESQILIPTCIICEKCYLFDIEGAKKWIDSLEKTLNTYSILRLDLQNTLKLLKVMLMYEEKDYDNFDKECRKVKRNLKNADKYYECEKVLINFFQSTIKLLSQENIEENKIKVIKKIDKFIEKFKTLSLESSNQSFFNMFNWITWLELKKERLLKS